MFRDTNLVLATTVVEEAVGAAFSDYYNLHPNERGMPRVLAQIPHSPEPEPEPRPFARFSKVDDLSVCNSAVDSVLSGALDQYYCLHPEERPRAQHFPRPMDVREVSVDSEARPAPRRSVDFLTLPLDERIANEAIAGALEEYNRIHGDHRPSLARLPQIGGSGGISSMSKHVNDSSSGPCFISPRKTLDEEVADSVISTALSDYYNLHPNERPRPVAAKPQEKPELVQHPREMTVVPPSWKPIEQIEREVVDTVVESALRQYYSMHPEERPRNT